MPRVPHRWIGLLLGAPLMWLGMSGAGLVYRDAMEPPPMRIPRTIDPHGRDRLPLHQVAARILAAETGAVITHLQMPRHPEGPLEFVIAKAGTRQVVAADPYTGDLLGLLHGGPATPVEPIRRSHANWLLGAVGRQANGIFALALALMALTGVALFVRNPRSMHGWLGLLAAPGMLLASLTGAMLIWGRVAPADPPRTGAAASLTLDHYAAAAGSALPEARISWIALGDPVTVRMRLPSDWQRRGSNEIHLHPATGAPLRTDLYRDAPLARRVYVALSALHFGETGGALARMAWAASGVVIGILWLSGFGVWWVHRIHGKP